MTHTDDETELRTRFARAADQIPVGPPPTEDGLRAGADRRRTVRVIAVAAVAGGVVAAGVVAANVLDPGSDKATAPADTSASEPAPERMRLDCPNDLRASGILDDFTPEGAASPVAVAMPYVDRAAGESTRVIEREDRTYVWILRPDGTARARLAVNYRAEYDGWILGPFYTCGDESLVPPGPRP